MVIEKVFLKLAEANIRFALMGGFAMGALGIVRSTSDIDILLLATDVPKTEKILKQFHYVKKFQSENVTHFHSELKPFGQIDIIHASRPISKKMLQRAVSINVFKQTPLNVLLPEDIIGLKLQALSNDPTRAPQEKSDIDLILKHLSKNKKAIDWPTIEEYFKLFDLEPELQHLKKQYDHAE